MKIKVLNVITDTNFGGAGRLLVNYLKNFDREKFDIIIAIPKGSVLVAEIEKLGYEIVETKYGADKSLEFSAIKELVGIIKRIKPDIVHAHASLSSRIAAYIAGVKSRIYTRHCYFDLPESAKRFPKKQISGFVNNTLSTEIVAVADAARQNLLETGANDAKITVIINGVDALREISDDERREVRKSMGVDDEHFLIGISARLEPVKGHDTFIKAAKIVSQTHPNARFMIMGTGSLSENLKRDVNDLGISDKVIFTGLIEDVTCHVNAMDLNINCSYGTETSSLALSEAMSVGKPALATAFGGNPYMITEDVNGYLYPTHDADTLASLMVKIMDDPMLYKKLSDGARQCYKTKFTARKMTKSLEDIYERDYNARCTKK